MVAPFNSRVRAAQDTTARYNKFVITVCLPLIPLIVQMVGGGSPGPCTDASGILAQFELLDILQSEVARATFDSPSETYWFDDQVRSPP